MIRPIQQNRDMIENVAFQDPTFLFDHQESSIECSLEKNEIQLHGRCIAFGPVEAHQFVSWNIINYKATSIHEFSRK